VTKRDDWVVLLPSTRQPNAEFFHLTPKDCFATRARDDATDSYLCPRYETLPPDALIKIGVIATPAVGQRILDWLLRAWGPTGER
jgi:hypothetical protein